MYDAIILDTEATDSKPEFAEPMELHWEPWAMPGEAPALSRGERQSVKGSSD